MPISRRLLLGTTLAAPAIARAQTPTIKIGVLNDQSGPYRDNTGQGSVVCARQAIEEFGDRGGFKVELLSADHQNKPDIGVGVARAWMDREGVDMILDVPTSSVALAVAAAVRGAEPGMRQFGAGGQRTSRGSNARPTRCIGRMTRTCCRAARLRRS